MRLPVPPPAALPAPLARLRAFAVAEARLLGPAGLAVVAGRATLQLLAGSTPALTLLAMDRILRAAGSGQVAWSALGLWALAAFAGNAVSAADPLLGHLQDQAITLRHQAGLLRGLAALPYATFLDPEGRDAVDRAGQGAERASAAYTATSDGLHDLGQALSLAVLLWHLWWPLPLVTALAVLPLALARWRGTDQVEAAAQAQTAERRRNGLLAALQFAPRWQPELRVLGVGTLLRGRWLRAAAHQDRVLVAAAWRGLRQNLPGQALAATGLLLCGGLLYGQFRHGHLGGADLVTGALAVLSALVGNSHVVADIASLRGNVRRLADFHHLAAASPPAAVRAARPPAVIRVEAVRYRYPTAQAPALDGISCTLTAGERVALVGANGSGKTTFLLVLMGLLQPEAGEVRYGDGLGAVADPPTPRAWSAVFQDFVRYPLTLRDNVGLGGPADAAIGDWLPPHLAALADRPLQRGYRGGTDLSGGQWQRVAVARALGRLQTRGLWFALDEATAALDPVAEAALADRLWSALDGHGAVLVSHRMGFARRADRILVFAGGRVVQDGPHETLLRGEGPYRALYRAQAEGQSGMPEVTGR